MGWKQSNVTRSCHASEQAVGQMRPLSYTNNVDRNGHTGPNRAAPRGAPDVPGIIMVLPVAISGHSRSELGECCAAPVHRDQSAREHREVFSCAAASWS